MSEPCKFCGGPCNPFDESTWTEVIGFVHGPKKDSLTLREPTGLHAHDACVRKAQQGIAPDQQSLFDDEEETYEPRTVAGALKARQDAAGDSTSAEADDLLLFDEGVPPDHDNPSPQERR